MSDDDDDDDQFAGLFLTDDSIDAGGDAGLRADIEAVLGVLPPDVLDWVRDNALFAAQGGADAWAASYRINAFSQVAGLCRP